MGPTKSSSRWLTGTSPTRWQWASQFPAHFGHTRRRTQNAVVGPLYTSPADWKIRHAPGNAQPHNVDGSRWLSAHISTQTYSSASEVQTKLSNCILTVPSPPEMSSNDDDNKRPAIMVTNDDGIDAAGLRALVRVLVSTYKYEVLVCAPDSYVLSTPLLSLSLYTRICIRTAFVFYIWIPVVSACDRLWFWQIWALILLTVAWKLKFLV